MATRDRSDEPPAQKATDEDLLAALERVTERLEAPAVPTSEIAAELPIARQTVKRRLDDLAADGRVASLATGQGRIWWLADGEGGHVDSAVLERPVDLESIDPYDIPPDLAEEIAAERVAGFDPPETGWQRLYAWSDGRADDVVTLIAVALVALLVPAPEPFAPRLAAIGIGVGLVDLFGLILLLLGLVVGLLAGLARIGGYLGQRAHERGYLGPVPPGTGLLER